MAGMVVVDYHKGNLSSVVRSLADCGADARVSDDAAEIAAASAVVLPGVGSFEDAMAYMNESGQTSAVRDAVRRGVPFLGICLGMQLVCERGNESADGSWVDGIGLIPGSVTRLESNTLKVPHVGWNQLDVTDAGCASGLFEGVASGANLYFTHSYALADDVPADAVAATCDYTRVFPAAIACGNIFGMQFHPEKSSRAGLALLANFVRIAKG